MERALGSVSFRGVACRPAACDRRRLARPRAQAGPRDSTPSGNEPLEGKAWRDALLGLSVAASLALPSETLAHAPAAAPTAHRGNELARASQHVPVELAEVADASAATTAAFCGPNCHAALPEYPTSVKIVLGELRQKTDDLRRMQFELDATQKMLYDSQAKMEDVQATKWQELGAVAVSCMGLAAGLRTYLDASLIKINVEKKRALVGLKVEVQDQLEGVMAEEVEGLVADRLANAVEAEIPTTMAALRQEQLARMELEEELEQERAAAQEARRQEREALKQERAERAVALARARDLHRQKEITKSKLFEAKRMLVAKRDAHAAADVERRLARVIIEARHAAETERALERVRADANAGAEQELALQRIVIEAQERRATELRKEVEEFRQEAMQLRNVLTEMASSDKGHIDVLQKRAQQAAIEQSSPGAEAGALYQQPADQLEAEHEQVAQLETQLEAAAEERTELDCAYLDAIDALHAERGRIARLQHDLGKAWSDLARSEEEVEHLRELTELAAAAPGHAASLSFTDEEVTLLQAGLHALGKQISLPEGDLGGLLALPSQVAKLADEVAALAEEVAAEEAAAAAEAAAEEAGAAAEAAAAAAQKAAAIQEMPVAGHSFDLFCDFPLPSFVGAAGVVDLGGVDLNALLQHSTTGSEHGIGLLPQLNVSSGQSIEVPTTAADAVEVVGLDGQLQHTASGEHVVISEQPAAEEQPVAAGEQPVAVVEQPVAAEEQPVAVVEQPVAAEEQPVAAEVQFVVEGQAVAVVERPVAAEEQAVAAEQAATPPSPLSQYSFWESQHTDVFPRTMVREWTDARFATATLAAFPNKAVANAEEARCLVERGGYVYLDVRPALELAEVGCVDGSFNIPVADVEWVDGGVGLGLQVVKRKNEAFLDQVALHFPLKDTPLMVGCSDGCSYAIGALETLEEAGYTCLVGLKGGYNAWHRIFDEDGNRRCSAAGGGVPANA